MSDEAKKDAAAEAPPEKKKSGVMTLVKAIAFVSLIVLLEMGAAAMLLPSAEETREVGQQLAKAQHEKDSGAHGEEHGDEHAEEHGEEHGDAHGGGGGAHDDTHEVTLGTYHIVSFNPKTGTSLSIDFDLFGVVLAEEEAEFSHLYTAHEKRISEQITIAVRGMESADLTDPGLGLIKRIILEKTNRALGKPLVREAIISQFSFMER